MERAELGKKNLPSAWEQVLRSCCLEHLLWGPELRDLALLDVIGPGVYRMPKLRRRSNRR